MTNCCDPGFMCIECVRVRVRMHVRRLRSSLLLPRGWVSGVFCALILWGSETPWEGLGCGWNRGLQHSKVRNSLVTTPIKEPAN